MTKLQERNYFNKLNLNQEEADLVRLRNEKKDWQRFRRDWDRRDFKALQRKAKKMLEDHKGSY